MNHPHRAWVRKLKDHEAPTLTRRWQSYIPGASGQFEHHATHAEALARIEMHNLKVLLVEVLAS